MIKLFEILDGIMSLDDRDQILSSVDNVCYYTNRACNIFIDNEQAKKIIVVGKKWIDSRNSRCDWSILRREIENELEASGDRWRF